MNNVSYSLLLLQVEIVIEPRHLYGAVALFVGLILLLIFTMLLVRFLKNQGILRQKQLQLQFKDWLVGVILEEADEDHKGFEVPENIQVLLRQSFAQEELLQELKRMKNSLSGQPGENLEKLYRQQRLSELSARSLRSRRWYSKARGIQELAVMNQSEFAEEIFPLINHRHPVVRMEAQIALVFLKQYEGLAFFESLVYPLTDYHQVKLLQLLASQPIPSGNVISRWLQSPNASVVQFTLKLIGEQHAVTFQDEVIACLGHPDENVRRQAIACLGEIPSVPVAKALREQFRLETNKELQITILSELTKTGAADDLPFLQELQEVQDTGVRLAAERTLQHLQRQVVA